MEQNEEIKHLRAKVESLTRMVKVLSALVDLQELPQGVTPEDYRRLLRGADIKPKRYPTVSRRSQ